MFFKHFLKIRNGYEGLMLLTGTKLHVDSQALCFHPAKQGAKKGHSLYTIAIPLHFGSGQPCP